jgi:ubiquitin-protein ligase
MKRIKREIMDLSKEDLGDIVLTHTDKSMYEWKASIPGPSGSPYAGGVFHLSITLPNDYRACRLLAFATSHDQC